MHIENLRVRESTGFKLAIVAMPVSMLPVSRLLCWSMLSVVELSLPWRSRSDLNGPNTKLLVNCRASTPLYLLLSTLLGIYHQKLRHSWLAWQNCMVSAIRCVTLLLQLMFGDVSLMPCSVVLVEL